MPTAGTTVATPVPANHAAAITGCSSTLERFKFPKSYDGRSGLSRLLLGGVTASVLSLAHIAVLVYRVKEEK